ncbi:AraC family transcriptional regulator, partial [Paenibacillus sepulcri]|nr:AraC family transcriptional regulator [Paenibacillus sepulcri]
GGKEADPKQFRVQLVFGVYNLLTLHFHETGGLPELKGVLEKINELRSSELMLDWLESMAREVRTRYLESKSPSRNEIDAVLDYIHDHFTEELMMYDLAASLHMSESKFSKLFKKQAGKSFMDYITELRINKAKELLLDPEVRIGEIALMVGYQETRYFSQLFKKTTGMTQKSFRRKLEKLKNNKEK